MSKIRQKKKPVRSKVKVTRVVKLAEDKHVVDLQLEVEGAPPPPDYVPPAEPLEIHTEAVPERTASSRWVDWLKTLW
jgi:hypothetical protein